MDILSFHAHVDAVNSALEVEGRCIFHNSDINVTATYLLKVPIGNVLPLCEDHCKYMVDSAADCPDDASMQPVWVYNLETEEIVLGVGEPLW